MIVSLISFIVTPFIYPIVYWLPDSWRAYKPLWYFFDDEDGPYGPVYWRNGKGITKRNFWVSYKWLGLRNRMWNLQASLKPIIGKEEMVECSGDLTQNGKLIDLSNVAVLMYVDKDGWWTHNVGESISKRFSKLGSTIFWFTIKDRLYWRYSHAGKINWKILSVFKKAFWIEIQIGIGNRYTFRFKLKYKDKYPKE